MTFFRRISDPEIGSGAVDVYAMMFACQFIIFIIIVFSWSAFSSPEVFPALSSPELCQGPAFSIKCSLLLVAWHLTNNTNSLHRGCGEVAQGSRLCREKEKFFLPALFSPSLPRSQCVIYLCGHDFACLREKRVALPQWSSFLMATRFKMLVSPC